MFYKMPFLLYTDRKLIYLFRASFPYASLKILASYMFWEKNVNSGEGSFNPRQ